MQLKYCTRYSSSPPDLQPRTGRISFIETCARFQGKLILFVLNLYKNNLNHFIKYNNRFEFMYQNDTFVFWQDGRVNYVLLVVLQTLVSVWCFLENVRR